MKKVNGISVFITLAVIIGLLAACGGDNDTTPNTDLCADGHDFPAWIEPTCTEAGNSERICSRINCNQTETRSTGFSALGHTYINSVCTACDSLDLEMVQIPAGTFLMGPDNFNNNATFTATLSAFKMSKYEITQDQYQEVMGNNPSYFNGGPTGGDDTRPREPATGEIQGKRPVEQVSWYNAILFCNKLSIREGLNPAYIIDGSTNPADWGDAPHFDENWETIGDINKWDAVGIVIGSNGYRLPTEAQWEYACRAGTTTIWYFGDIEKESELIEYAWCASNSSYMTHQVGKKLPNLYGLYDMAGNVLEWCWDWKGSYPSESQTDYSGSTSGSSRVFRGGDFLSGAGTYSADRGSNNPIFGFDSYGFRVVRP